MLQLTRTCSDHVDRQTRCKVIQRSVGGRLENKLLVLFVLLTYVVCQTSLLFLVQLSVTGAWRSLRITDSRVAT